MAGCQEIGRGGIYINKSFYLAAAKGIGGEYSQIRLHINSPIDTGLFKLKTIATYGRYINKPCYYLTDTLNVSGELLITKYDTINDIVAGQFWFTAYNYRNLPTDDTSNCKPIIHITEGRFDIDLASFSVYYN